MWTLPSAIAPGAVASPVVFGCAFGAVWVPAALLSPAAAFFMVLFFLAPGWSAVWPAGCSAAVLAAGFAGCFAGVDDCAKAVAPSARAPTRVPAITNFFISASKPDPSQPGSARFSVADYNGTPGLR